VIETQDRLEPAPVDSAPSATSEAWTPASSLVSLSKRPNPSPATEPAPQAGQQTGHLQLNGVSAYYGSFQALRDVDLELAPRRIHAVIGPSGCGKSTLIRAVNRMHELTPDARVTGSIQLDGRDIYGPSTNAVRVRRVIGMVFQRPNPFPTMSIFDNVAAGLKLAGGGPKGGQLRAVVEESLHKAALWDQVKDKLKNRAGTLSGGQQQRLCIARALAVGPKVLLMDEPCSALDPIATGRIEDLIRELSHEVTIVIVTHNLQQAVRVSHTTSFFLLEDNRQTGYLVETGSTEQIFSSPKRQLTQDYVSGRFG